MVNKTIRKVLKKNDTNKYTFKKIKVQNAGAIEKGEAPAGLYNQNKELDESAIEQSLRISRSGLKLMYPGDINTSKNNAMLDKQKNTRKFGFTDFASDSGKKAQLTPKFFYKNIYPSYCISHMLETPTQTNTVGVGQSTNDNNNENTAENESKT